MTIQDVLQHLDSLFRNNDIAKVEPFLLEHLDAARKRRELSLELTILNELMGFYRGMGRHREAIAQAVDALGLLEDAGYKGSVPYATTLLNAATAYRADGQNIRANQAYNEVAAIYRAQKMDDPYLWASLHNNQSLAWQGCGRHERALASLELALPLIASRAGSEADQAVTLTNMAQSKMRLGRFDEAGADLDRAIALFESQTPRNPHYGAALSARGELAFRQGDTAEAIRHFEAALPAIETNYGRSHNYAVTLESLATVIEATDPTRAGALREEAAQIEKTLA
ncbi:tetratricopeptide repeat protein [Uliginosibacterium paludis]|uniref:Tetratricopeptide repeat protein n=1 Tax=Uliginosibacterium paludis TaxID=1615952 RepID=A0ABV2CSW4_9RHOO